MKEIVSSEGAPRAVGPYVQAVRHGGLLFLSGQIGLDPRSGALVPGGVAAETRRALENLRAVLAAGGADPSRVLRTTVYLTDMAQFAEMNEAYAAFFEASPPPARSTVAVAALPKGALVEIDAIASV